MTRRGRSWAGVALTLALGTTGCGYEGLNSLSLPGTQGHGAGAFDITLTLDNAVNLVPNSEVLVGDINVGTVRSIELSGFTPTVTLRLNGDVKLPRNVTVKVGQTSLLGAKHIQLLEPPSGQAVGRLKDGDVLGPEQTGRYPETEDVLASTALLLNGGGFQQLKTITTELNRALGGREGTVKSLLTRADALTAGLDAQRVDIVDAITSLDRISGRLEKGNAAIDRALTDLPPALAALERQRGRLVSTLNSIGTFGVELDEFIAKAGSDLVINVSQIVPAVKGLADAGTSLVDSLYLVAGLAFPVKHFAQIIRGDFLNLWATVDLGLDTLDKTLLAGTPLQGSLGGIAGLIGKPLPGNAGSAGNPLTDPVSGLTHRRTGAPSKGGPTVGGPGGLSPGVPTPSPSPSAGPEAGSGGLAGLLNGPFGGGR